MTKSFASLLFIAGAVSLAGACSGTNDLPAGSAGAPGNVSGAGNVAGSTGTPTAGSGNVAGNTGVGGAGTAGSGSVAGSGTGGSSGAGTGTAGSGTAGSGTAGSGTGGAVNPGDGGAGYWVEKDWHGCAWTGVGKDGASTITPKDFTAKPPADAFCVSGTVGAEPMYKSVALLGFNVAQPPSASCVYKPLDATAAGEPSVVPTANGIALDFVKRGTDTSFTLRVQIQGPNGHKDGTAGEADRWCATITEVQGQVFVKWADFTPKCWEKEGMRGTPYAMQPISAVSFTVPGKLTDTPYDFCVNGFTYGTSAADAPKGPATGGAQTGTVGIANTANNDGDFRRAKVVVDGKQYIIQNNNWGNPLGTDLILSYKDNSFKITSGSGSNHPAPASFPSIYIGNNGNTANGVYSTKTTDGLPIKISDIKSAVSTFRYSGSTTTYNATYDIWFSKTIPTTEYKDGIDGFIMIWLRDPTGEQPIGSKMTQVNVANQTWDVWVGERGEVPGVGYNPAKVVSFVRPLENDQTTDTEPLRDQSFKDVDLKLFFAASATYGITPDMYLTDVFGGFEIWNGGSGGNLGVDEFKAVITKN